MVETHVTQEALGSGHPFAKLNIVGFDFAFLELPTPAFSLITNQAYLKGKGKKKNGLCGAGLSKDVAGGLQLAWGQTWARTRDPGAWGQQGGAGGAVAASQPWHTVVPAERDPGSLRTWTGGPTLRPATWLRKVAMGVGRWGWGSVTTPLSGAQVPTGDMAGGGWLRPWGLGVLGRAWSGVMGPGPLGFSPARNRTPTPPWDALASRAGLESLCARGKCGREKPWARAMCAECHHNTALSPCPPGWPLPCPAPARPGLQGSVPAHQVPTVPGAPAALRCPFMLRAPLPCLLLGTGASWALGGPGAWQHLWLPFCSQRQLWTHRHTEGDTSTAHTLFRHTHGHAWTSEFPWDLLSASPRAKGAASHTAMAEVRGRACALPSTMGSGQAEASC